MLPQSAEALEASRHGIPFAHLYTSSTLFPEIIAGQNTVFFFDSKWRRFGDADWVLRAMDKGIRIDVLGEFLSVFTDNGRQI